MARLLTPNSEPCAPANICIFDTAPSQVAFTKGAWLNFVPAFSTSDSKGPFVFHVHDSTHFLQLNKTYISFRCKVDTSELKAEDGVDETALTNFIGCSPFQQIKLSFNNVLVFDSNLYSYKDYIQTLLSSSSDDRKGILSAAGWFDNDDDNDFDSGLNSGFKMRVKLVENGVVDIMAPLLIDPFLTEKHLIPHVNMQLTLYRHSDQFVLQSKTQKNAKLEIQNMRLHMKAIEVNPSAALAIEAKLNSGTTAKYPYTSVRVKTLSIPGNRYDLPATVLYNDIIPRKIICCLVDADAAEGVITKDPFNMKPYDLAEITVDAGGMVVPMQPITSDFENNNYTRQYGSRLKCGRNTFNGKRATPWRLKSILLLLKEILHNPNINDLFLVVYAYEQALLCLGYYPDIWYEAALFLQEASKHLEQKGDIKTAQLMTSECIQLFERSINGLMKESQLLYFSYADFEEERMKFDNVKKIYEKLLGVENVDPTLTYVQYMKFIRRTEGCVAARTIFKKGREDTRCNHHIYIASAYMEYYCNKRVFDLGLKKYGASPDYAAAFVDFLCHLNEDNNTRVVFERILTSGNMPVPSQSEIWDRYLEFESLVGDLSSILKVDTRRKEICNEADTSTHMLIDRYKFLNLIPCTPEQLKLMGYNKALKGHSAPISAAAPTTSGAVKNQGPQAASAVMGGTLGNMELGGFPKPDTDQMIPFKAKANTAGTYHPVPGGIFPAPPTVAHLKTMLPPPWSFKGPFVNIDALIDQINRYSPPTATSVDTKIKLENGSMLGPMRVEDVKKEFYQLLATTTDPNVAMTSGEYIHMKRKRAADSESDDDISRGDNSRRDIYKRRMNQKTVDL